MKKITITLALLALMLSSCNSAHDLWDYYNKTKDFTRYLNSKDYEQCISMLDMPLMEANGLPKDSLTSQMKRINELIAENFGKVEYSAPRVEVNTAWLGEKATKQTFPVATVLFDNGRTMGQMDITFDGRSKKIRAFYLRYVQRPVPGLAIFWLFMLIGLINAGFIIYVVIRVKRSNSKRKKRKYLLALLLNLPTISLNTLSGISLHLLSIQFLLGSSFSKYGYIARWDLALPLGAIIVLSQLRKEKKVAEAELEQDMLEAKWAQQDKLQETDEPSPSQEGASDAIPSG